MSTKPDTSKDSESPKYSLLELMTSNPVAGDPDEHDSSKKKQHDSDDFNNDDIQRKMDGVISDIHPASSNQDHKTTTKMNTQRPASPLVGQQAGPPKRVTSPQLSKKDTNVLVVDDHKKPKARKNSSSGSSGDEENKHKDAASKRKPPTRQNSPDHDEHKPSNKSAGEKTSSTKQQEHPDSYHTKQAPTASSNAKKHDRHSSASSDDSHKRASKPKQSRDDSPSKTGYSTISAAVQDPKKLLHKERKNSSSDESEQERLNNSKVSRANHSSQHEKSTQSKHDQSLSSKKDEPTAHPTKHAHKSSDDEHSDDDKRASHSKKKAAEDNHNKTTTATIATQRAKDFSKSSHSIFDIVNKSIDPTAEPTSHKSTQAAKPTASQHHPPSRRNSTDEHKKAYDYFDDDDDLHKKPARKTDPQSDTDQKKTDKEPKRRRPKRISRTTQTHEYIFRRMEREQHEELFPTNDTDKNIQTRQSQLRPRRKSPKKGNSVYLSSDQYKIEQIKPNKSSSDQQKGSTHTEKSSAQNGKLLILRPTLPIHHSSAVKVERVKLQYAIDLVRDDSKRDKSPAGHRNKSTTRKQADHPQRSQRASSTASSTADAPKNKSGDNKKDHRTWRRTTDGAV